MKKYLKEIIILLIQLFMFYVFPLFAGPTDAMGMVFIILFSTLILSLIITLASKRWFKYFYPFICALTFIPTIFIHYNSSASIHAVWYLIISSIGMVIGIIINKIVSLCK